MKKNHSSESGVLKARLLVALALSFVGVSLGLRSFAGASTSSVTSTSASAPGFHAPVTMPGSSSGTEPSLAITNSNNGSWSPAGIRYVSWQVPGEFAKSADGVNFVQVTTPDSGASGDVTNAMGSNGALYNAQICGAPTILHTCVYRSLDGGVTWQTRNMLADNHPGASDRPWIAVRAGADPDHDTVYLEFHTFSPDDLVYVTKSTDGGATFGAPVPPETGTNSAIPDSQCNTIPGGIVVNQSNGDVYALWLSGDQVAQNVVTGCNYSQIGPFTKAWVSRSTDGGLTWAPALAWHGAYDVTTNIGDNAGKIFSTISQDTSGQVHIGLSVRHNDDPRAFLLDCETNSNCLEAPNPTDMYIVTSPDLGAHWTLPFKVNQNTGSYFFPWIHAGSAGRLVVANYFSSTLQPNNKTSVWYIGMYQVAGAVAHYLSGANATYDSAPIASPQVQLDPNRVHGDGTTGGGICTYGTFCLAVPGSNRGLADVFEIHLDPAGGANVTWTSSFGGTHIGFACQDSGPSSLAGAPDLNGCYGPADMAITKLGSPESVMLGATLSYHLTVVNNGAGAMAATTSGVTVTDVLPAGTGFVSATPSQGTCTATSTVVCDLGIFPSGATATIDIVVTAPAVAGPLTNTATVSALTSDPNTANNSASVVTTVTPLTLTKVTSRKTHGAAGTFDIPLPQSGSPAVECRTSGAQGNYTMVFTFPAAVTGVTGRSAIATTAIGTQPVTVLNTSGIGTDTREYIVNLTGVPNASRVTVTLQGVTVGSTTGNVSARMAVLIGDVTGTGRTDNGDAIVIRNLSGKVPTDSTTARADVNCNGRIDNGDAIVVRNNSGTGLP
jgi:uncharacterized repeat protein (TIGR01451 family)